MARSLGGPDLGFTKHEIIRSDTFREFVKGDRVQVTEDRFAGLWFEFEAHATHIPSGNQWVELWGGTRGHQTLEPVNPEHIRKKS